MPENNLPPGMPIKKLPEHLKDTPMDPGFKCPMNKLASIPMGCMFCEFGHMLDCHYPKSCEEAMCSHYQAEV
jgi:hypothetical protein